MSFQNNMLWGKPKGKRKNDDVVNCCLIRDQYLDTFYDWSSRYDHIYV